jgi:predicted NACHT family NTPase
VILNLTPLRTVEGINHLATRYPKCPIVVTSRRAGWKGLLAPTFITMSILDFGWEDIQRFMNNWFGEGSDRARRLKNILSQQVRMQALAANPLLLSLIAIVFERDLELPERRAKLYERCVQV